MIAATRLFRWGSPYRLDVPVIDQEHERLAELLNRLYEAHRNGAGRAEIAVELAQFSDSAAEHFATEEDLMADGEYPGLDAHRAEHEFLRAQVKDFQRKFLAGRAELSESMMIYLKDWLRDHILVSDRRLASFLNGSR